jgi:hypothetical protein
MPFTPEAGSQTTWLSEGDLRRIAIAARSLLPTIVPASEVPTVDGELAAALTLPTGRAKIRLLRALGQSHPALGDWYRNEVRKRQGHGRPHTEPRPPGPIEIRGPGSDDDRGREPARRFLAAEVPDQIRPGEWFSVLVSVDVVMPGNAWSAAFDLDVPPAGLDLVVVVSAPPGLQADGALTNQLHVPADGGSGPIRFGFRASAAGAYQLIVRLFRGGTPVGELQWEVIASESVKESVVRTNWSPIKRLAADPGEMTLVVDRTDHGRYRLQLMGRENFPAVESERLTGDSGQEVSHLADELGLLATGTSTYRGPARLSRLENLGMHLWRKAVPETIREQFWQEHDRISAFTVQTDTDPVPWELMYPLDGQHDQGFLAEQFPVLRRATGQSGTHRIRLRKAAFVVPPGSPTNAREEVARIRALLGESISMQDVSEYQELDELLTKPAQVPGLLHFSCHNQFRDGSGARIQLTGAPFEPQDLARAVGSQTLLSRAPLVFVNACRSAGQTPNWTQLTSWASEFISAGAGAFVGSLWDVRSSAAAEFAECFYDALVIQNLSLGEAVLTSRMTGKAAAKDGDPTWLAYTVYGSPAARIGRTRPTIRR